MHDQENESSIDAPDPYEFRPYIGPVPRGPGRMPRAITAAIITIAAIWIVALNATHILPSRFTITSMLVALIIYAGNYVDWKFK